MTDQSAADRIAAAPRAWVVFSNGRPVAAYDNELVAKMAAAPDQWNGTCALFAIVPLTEKEVSQ